MTDLDASVERQCQFGSHSKYGQCRAVAEFYCDDPRMNREAVQWCAEHVISCPGHEHPPFDAAVRAGREDTAP